MDALPNATSGRGRGKSCAKERSANTSQAEPIKAKALEIKPHSVELTLNALPLQKGVSVKYAYDPNKRWYVLRATYGRADKAYRHIISDGIEAYIPLHYIIKHLDGKRQRVKEPLLPNIIFVYTSEDKVDKYVHGAEALPYLNYYYNHFKKRPNGNDEPLTVGYNDMINFINLTCISSDHIRTVKLEQCHFKSGDEVRVVSGQFQGIRGKIARVAGQQRVVITIEGLCSVATAYIPSDFIELVKQTSIL